MQRENRPISRTAETTKKKGIRIQDRLIKRYRDARRAIHSRKLLRETVSRFNKCSRCDGTVCELYIILDYNLVLELDSTVFACEL